MTRDETPLPTTVDNLQATRITATASGAGTFPAGTVRYGYLVDWGKNRIVIIVTTAPAGDSSLATNQEVVDGMAASIEIKG